MSRIETRDLFDRVVSANRVALLSYFQRRLANPADAAEAFGELLLTAWRSRRRMPADEIAARMWLYGVARNVLRNTHRAAARRSAAVQQFKEQVAAASVSTTDPRHDDVRDAIAALPAEDAELVRLTYWDGLASHEAAQVLGINPSTARSRLTRARAAIRVTIESNAESVGQRDA
jgi:RNA polymerase sigma-70 factor (ECF subfamily)